MLNNDGVTKDLGALEMHRGMDLYIRGGGRAIQDLLLLPPQQYVIGTETCVVIHLTCFSLQQHTYYLTLPVKRSFQSVEGGYSGN